PAAVVAGGAASLARPCCRRHIHKLDDKTSPGTFQERLQLRRTPPHPPADAGASLPPLWQGGGWREKRLSVVVPTLNVADTLQNLLGQLRRVEIVKEIIIVDGGSADGPVAISRAAGAQVFVAPRGRGVQLAAGAAAAGGDWLLFLHADCRLARGWEPVVAAFIAAPGANGHAGYFDFALDDPAPAARRLERIVA